MADLSDTINEKSLDNKIHHLFYVSIPLLVWVFTFFDSLFVINWGISVKYT